MANREQFGDSKEALLDSFEDLNFKAGTICRYWFRLVMDEKYQLISTVDIEHIITKYYVMNFDLIRGIYGYGFNTPSVVQQRAIIPLIQHKNMVIQAPSGAGKTAAISIAALQILDLKEPQCQILIIVPTCESAQGIHHMIEKLGVHLKVTSNVVSYGDSRSCVTFNDALCTYEIIPELRHDVQILVGTLWEVRDMLFHGKLRLDALKSLVLDELDRMIHSRFIKQIFQYLPGGVQVAVSSVTMPNEILQLTERFMRNPVRILVKKEELSVTLDGIKQYYVVVKKEDYKLATLYDLYESITVIEESIIYCNTRWKVMWLADKMKQYGFTVSAIHGDMHQKEWELVMKEFQSGSTRVLITTGHDLLARGMADYTGLLVINYDFPIYREDYFRRIGCNESKVVAINFVCDEDEWIFREIEKCYKIKIEELPMDVDSIWG